ncbi:histone deacetylase family protein [Wenzhouxiangella limi]|uniref:Histone deacetylase family protein n=1 Tax=Wenzhouxiangella limi TaxID=2707351 RepID=A0A845V1F3_9GAMM|nr:histone deacetylase family protein [Wenzhouxiangella limi]NDY96060.1 histone deacetylase family protein [Wenzhouxiangella limi]
MSLIVLTHPDCLAHTPPAGHPERAERLQAALAGVEQLDQPEVREAELVDDTDLARMHGFNYLQSLTDLDASGSLLSLDPDTYIGRGSLRAARLAAGAVCGGVDQVMAQPGQAVFAAVRPPGHHAESARAMGFCLLNSIAVAAGRAADVHGLKRIGVVDFDVHHGNGTEAILQDDPRFLFVSSHQAPLYPGTGDPATTKASNVVNATLTANSGSDEFRALWTEHLLPALDRFKPQLVLVSAGFDGHWRDPLAQLQLKDEDYYWIGEQLTGIARNHASGRLVASLEGGYDLAAITESVVAFGESIE